MSADKNHEQYLEEIETAVAETTKALMENEDYNLRKACREIAQQKIEIKRLKEYQSNDRKTIRNLRARLAEATEDISGYESICKEYIGDTDEYISPTRLRDYVDDFTDEVRELEKLVGEKEEEIETLKQAEKSQTKYWEGCIRTCEEKTKAELDKYKTLIHCVWSDLYWADKYGEDVGWKDIAYSCDYFDNEEFIKKEVVDDSDED